MLKGWRRSPDAFTPTVISWRNGEALCGSSGEVIRFQRRECELMQILHKEFGHFVAWQEVARKLFAITDEARDESALIRVYAHTIRRKIDRKCSFGIEGRQGYGYRLFGLLLVDDYTTVAGAVD